MSTNRWTDKEAVAHVHMDYYYSAIKRNTSESVLMRQMSLEPVIQSEISQTVKDKYRIEMHTYESKKTVLTILLASQQRRHRHFGHSGGGDSGIKWEKQHWNIYITICKTDSQWEFNVWCREPKASALWQPRGVGWGEGCSRGRGHVYT